MGSGLWVRGLYWVFYLYILYDNDKDLKDTYFWHATQAMIEADVVLEFIQ